MGLADLSQLHIRLSGCSTGLIDPGQLYIGLPGCAMGLTRYISRSVQLCSRTSLSSPIIHQDMSMLSSCATGQVNSGQLYIRISPVRYRGNWIPTQLIGHGEYRVSITGIRLHNRHSWPSMQNINMQLNFAQ